VTERRKGEKMGTGGTAPAFSQISASAADEGGRDASERKEGEMLALLALGDRLVWLLVT